MARIAGKGGQIYVGLATSTSAAQPVAFMKTFDFSAVVTSFECTAFGDLNKTYVVGLPDAQVKFDGFYDDATVQTYTAAQDGLARRCYLYPNAVNTPGQYWYGTGFFDFDVNVDVGGVVSVSGTMVPATAFTKVG